MSRVELDGIDRASVESVRRRLKALDAQGVGELDRNGLIDFGGRLAALLDALLAVINGPSCDEGSARCPAAHHDDPTPCDGPTVVTVLDRQNAGADGCEHHGARLLASLDGGRVYALPDAPAGAAVRVFKAVDGTRPFCWYEGTPRTRPDQLSHRENRQREENR